MGIQNDRPPRPAFWLLARLSVYSDRYLIEEDLEEEYRALRRSHGRRRARLWFWRQTFLAVGYYVRYVSSWRNLMIKNFFKITFRNMGKHKGYSFINIFGLAVGMASCLFILLWVRDELSFDRFHENADKIYRVTEHQYDSSGDYFPVAVTPWPLAEALKADYPEIVESARLRIWSGRLISYRDKKFYERDFVAADPSFLKMFSFPIIKGDGAAALTEPNTVLITEDTAARYFGTEDPIGKTLTYNNSVDFRVTGVLRNVPANSHIRIDFLVPFESTLRLFGWAESWGTNNYTTYVRLAGSASPGVVAEKIRDYQKKIWATSTMQYILQPLTDIHLRSDYAIDLYGQTENKSIYVTAFSVIALFVLLIACINFMNLSTARAEKRSKEVGLRKVIGAGRRNIMVQFYAESLLMTIVSFAAALLLVTLLLPAFNHVAGKALTLTSIKEPIFLFGMLGLLLITGLVSGSYPALVLSSFKPIDSLKGGGQRFSSKSGKSLFRRSLVVIQFTVSIVLIIGTLIVYQQIQYMLNKELGYNKESIVYFSKRGNLRTQYDAFKTELLRDPDIVHVASSSDVPTYTVHSTSAFQWEGKDPETNFLIHQFSVDFDYIRTFDMNILAGRNFSREFPVDETTKSFILNETAVQSMGLENPVGKKFSLWNYTGQIVGVVEDFHFKSLQAKIEPLVLRIDPERDSFVFVKFRSDHTIETIGSIRRVYDSFNPEFPLAYTFLDEAVGRLYDAEKKTRAIFNSFTLIAILISCLGLFGLAAFMAQQKTREIGVRKVLGASIPSLMSHLSREFIILVGAANIAAWPLAYLVMSRWLHNFAYRTRIDPLIFILGGVVSTLLGLLTVSYHTAKSARANPVESLRYE